MKKGKDLNKRLSELRIKNLLPTETYVWHEPNWYLGQGIGYLRDFRVNSLSDRERRDFMEVRPNLPMQETLDPDFMEALNSVTRKIGRDKPRDRF